MLRIGSHVSISNGLLGAALEAESYGASAFMIYTGAPQNSIRKPLEKLKINEGRKYMEEIGIPIENVVIHAPYIVNLASNDPEKQNFAVSFLKKEIERTDKIGAPFIVLHPGSNQDKKLGIDLIAKMLNNILSASQNAIVCLETMSGKGNEIGASFSELKAILDRIYLKDKAAVCFDTCHVFDAGYDIVNDYKKVMDDFDKTVGLQHIKVVHVNGSLNPIAKRKDRHANIGAAADNPKGMDYIGFRAIHNIVHSKELSGRIFILETPWITKTSNLYKEEIAKLKCLP